MEIIEQAITVMQELKAETVLKLKSELIRRFLWNHGLTSRTLCTFVNMKRREEEGERVEKEDP